jgi:catechol 2,3-dioxygenase-like lactoylglutathione lyase family enzyme
MRFHNSIAFVDDIPRSTAFYRDVIGIAPLEEYDTFVLFADGFSIHDGDAIHEPALGRPREEPHLPWGRNNLILYLVSDDLERDFARVSAEARILHPIKALPSGELAFRCLDPDGHFIEIGDGIYEPHAGAGVA